MEGAPPRSDSIPKSDEIDKGQCGAQRSDVKKINNVVNKRKSTFNRGKKLPKDERVGNFRSYYNYRLGNVETEHFDPSRVEDSRLEVLCKEWFAGKNGLDIGCNSGEFTITFGWRFAPLRLLGVDIDMDLISKAQRLLKKVTQQSVVETAYKDVISVWSLHAENNDYDDIVDFESFLHEMPVSFKYWKPMIHCSAGDGDCVSSTQTRARDIYPYNIQFRQQDVMSSCETAEQFDFVLCLSVTKWIHLLHGDEGIRQLFRKVYAVLKPGGRFILEPQPWKSYHKRKFTSGKTEANYGRIQLRPKLFPEYLTHEIGFKSCEFIQVCQTSSKGFRRPIYVVQK